jgi:hypothetical protein
VKQALLAFRAVRRVESVPRGVSLQARLFHGVASGRSCRVPTKTRTPAAAEQPPTPRVGPTRLRSHRTNQRRRQAPRLFSTVAPNTLPLPQAGPVSAAQLLITADGNFGRFRNEAAFGGTLRRGAPPGFLRKVTPYATPPAGKPPDEQGYQAAIRCLIRLNARELC